MAIVGRMIGLALLMVASLLSMALWVHKRGRFGLAASRMLRSLSPIVYGLADDPSAP
jgi:hypothetical protein